MKDKPSEALRLARKLLELERNKVKYVCVALARTNHPASEVANAHVRDLLEGYHTYEEWLRAKHKIPSSELTEEDKIQVRLAWIDNMIKYWEAKGM